MRLLLICLSVCAAAETRQATGVKVGEVSETGALVWMRVTARSAREADGAAPGAPGRVRFRYAASADMRGAQSTAWATVGERRDYSHQFAITGLKADTRYFYHAETSSADGKERHDPLKGSFHTAPPRDAPASATFTVITGQAYRDLDSPEGFRIYDAMLRLKPRFLVPTGDTVYYDTDPPIATTEALARLHWQRMYSLPLLLRFHLEVPGYWEKDDHDTVFNDCWPTMNPKKMLPMTFEAGQRIFLQQVPMGDRTYRRVRWGKRLEVWLVEGRDFRSPNNMPDGPEKTIWGAAQKKWLKDTLLASDAEWRVLVSPTPIVGPDRGNKGDNHANRAFAHEGNEFRAWAAKNLPDNFFVACGDRHWQYHSVDPKTGVQEFSSGPVSDEHAGGSPGENKEYHKFHRMKGGFLSVTADAAGIAFRFHDVRGAVVYEWKKAGR